MISLFLAVTVYFWERNEVGEAVVAHALYQVERFNTESEKILDEPDLAQRREQLRKDLEVFSARQIDRQDLGRAVFVNIFDLEGGAIVSFTEDDYPHRDEIAHFMASSKPNIPEGTTTFHTLLRFSGDPHIRFIAPLVGSTGEQVGVIDGVFAVSLQVRTAARRRLARAILIAVSIVLATALILYPIALQLVGRLTKLSRNLLEANLETLELLGSTVAKRDSDTQAHSYRVTIYAVRLAESLGLTKTEIQRLIKGAFLHDVGKIAITDNILHKPGGLTDEEYGVMKTHVKHGADIVERSAWLNSALDVVSFHHEKFDGNGYLAGLSGEKIPLSARIFAIADVFDALTSRRPYKDPFSLERTMDVMEAGRGTHFDPRLLDAFSTLAGDLYGDLVGKEDDLLESDLRDLVKQYFSGGLESLEA